MDLTTGTASYTFDGFDSALGTLTGVKITFTAKQRADVTVQYVDATGGAPATKSVATSIVPVQGEAPSSSAVITFGDATSTQIGVNNFNKQQTETLSNGAAPLALTDLLAGTSNASDTANSADFSYFFSSNDGADRIANIASNGNLLGTVAGTTVTTNVSDYWAEGTVSIEYTFTEAAVVPEPSSAMLGLLAAGALVFRRKRA